MLLNHHGLFSVSLARCVIRNATPVLRLSSVVNQEVIMKWLRLRYGAVVGVGTCIAKFGELPATWLPGGTQR